MMHLIILLKSGSNHFDDKPMIAAGTNLISRFRDNVYIALHLLRIRLLVAPGQPIGSLPKMYSRPGVLRNVMRHGYAHRRPWHVPAEAYPAPGLSNYDRFAEFSPQLA